MQKRERTIHTIYDRIGKRCLALSKRSTIQLINGLYEKNYPEDSAVEYNWTEHHDDDLKKRWLIQLLQLTTKTVIIWKCR